MTDANCKLGARLTMSALSKLLMSAMMVLVSWRLCVVGAPVGSSKTRNASPTISISQPLHIEELSTEELFKAVVAHDAVVLSNARSESSSSSGRPVGLMSSAPLVHGRTEQLSDGWSLYKLPSLLDYPISLSRSHLVSFDTTRPAVQLPLDPRDLHASIKSFAFNRFYIRLNRNHAGTYSDRASQAGWLDRVQYSTNKKTELQMAKEGVMAKAKAFEWAQRMAKEHPGWMSEEQVQSSLDKTWALWSRGLGEATGYAYIPVDLVKSKMLRRQLRA